MCECVWLRRAADLLNVRVHLLADLAAAGHVHSHKHDGRMTITRESLDNLRWRLACARLEAVERNALTSL